MLRCDLCKALEYRFRAYRILRVFCVQRIGYLEKLGELDFRGSRWYITLPPNHHRAAGRKCGDFPDGQAFFLRLRHLASGLSASDEPALHPHLFDIAATGVVDYFLQHVFDRV